MRVSSKKDKKDIDLEKSKPTIHVIDLIDRSGSMGEKGKYVEAEAGINTEIETLKKDENAEYSFTVIEFDSYYGEIRYNTPYFMTRIHGVTTFKGAGPGNMTPLYQAIGETIKKMLTYLKEDDRVLLNIFTDGEENESRNGWGIREGGAQRLKELMQKVKKENNFTITFIGTQFDVEKMIANTGIDRGNTYTYDGTGKGTKMSMNARAGQTVAYSKAMASGQSVVDNFFEKEIEGDK